MKNNYKKTVALVLAFIFVIFGVLGAFAQSETQEAQKKEKKIVEQQKDIKAQKSESTAVDKDADADEDDMTPPARSGRWTRLLQFIVNAIILGIVGVLLLIIGYYIWEMITVNYSVREQLVDHKNVAVAIVTASFVLGMAIVIGIALTKI